MSAAPSVLRIKRKRGEEPVESLFVQSSDGSKRVRTGESYVFHRLVKESDPLYDARTVSAPAERSTTVPSLTASERQAQRAAVPPRRFHLSHPSPSASIDQKGRKRSQDSANIAVVVEDRPASVTREQSHATTAPTSKDVERPAIFATQTVTKKPPGGRYGNPRPPPPRKRMQSISQEKRATFEQWAQEEMGAMVVGDSTAPRSMTAPTITPGVYGVASSGVQKERGADMVEKQTGVDAMETDDDGDYVYDTYIRHTMQVEQSSASTGHVATQGSEQPVNAGDGNIGYLVISDADIELWETYASDPDEADDKDDWDSEQDDENAENYYGADYPEDEVSGDDEHDTNAYRYRTKSGGLSDDEEYDLADNSSDQDDAEEANELDELEPWRRQEAARTGVYRLGVGEVSRRRRFE